METYNIATTAGYKGCGQAFATIQNNIVTALIYIGGFLTCDDYEDADNGIIGAQGEIKISEFAEAHPKMQRGICSCWKFCVD